MPFKLNNEWQPCFLAKSKDGSFVMAASVHELLEQFRNVLPDIPQVDGTVVFNYNNGKPMIRLQGGTIMDMAGYQESRTVQE